MTALAVDTSAIIAVMNDEPDATSILECALSAETLFISAATVHECNCVLVGRRDPSDPGLEEFLATLGFRVIPFDMDQASLAKAAYQIYGKGSGHPAGLNMGDCFSYALAKSRDLPLLYKGGDFAETDVAAALEAK
ncbi:MAG: type II toxin-antitoxin system VapC family toxin [Hyphomicrobiales bacterium]|nr:type II toxin-antitoxin system VapC family toxin [Nitratireductor sp.]MCC2098960.1 type II toxin-antitoxin system VapC family toxin [Hyphomicrobiales bacterium]